MLSISERRACAALGQYLSTQHKIPRGREDEDRITEDLIELARHYGRYGYRKIAELLRLSCWLVNDKRVERLWQREGLKDPKKQPTSIISMPVGEGANLAWALRGHSNHFPNSS